MKRWAVLTVLLYLLIQVLLTPPLVLFFTIERSPSAGWEMSANWSEALKTYGEWGYWLWLAVLGLGQALLLLVPVRIAKRKLIPRRRLLVPVITAAFLFANVFFGTLLAMSCAIFADDAFKIFEVLGTEGFGPWLTLILVVLGLWTIWGVFFYQFTKDAPPDRLSSRLMGWLLRGSILELLVAVPSHIIVRNRGDCCAPAATFWGIVTGLSVMLMSFGPGVFFLFAQRFGRLRAKKLGTDSETDSVQAPSEGTAEEV